MLTYPRPCFFSFNDTAPTEIYTLSLHDALPVSIQSSTSRMRSPSATAARWRRSVWRRPRSEEHTSELQSPHDLVCRLLREKKKDNHNHCHEQKEKKKKKIVKTA